MTRELNEGYVKGQMFLEKLARFSALDAGIVRTVWLSRDEIAASRARHRSPYVLACVDDYLAGRRFPLDLVRHFAGVAG